MVAKKKMYPLLKGAPDHESPEFIDYLRKNNVVLFESENWIVIKNCKFHTAKKPWYTAFFKSRMVEDSRGRGQTFWWEHIEELAFKDWLDWEWLKKAEKRQSIKRFHIHIYKP